MTPPMPGAAQSRESFNSQCTNFLMEKNCGTHILFEVRLDTPPPRGGRGVISGRILEKAEIQLTKGPQKMPFKPVI